MTTFRKTRQCRFCGAPLSFVLIDLGQTPLSNNNLSVNDVSAEQSYPLVVRVCETCLLVQVDDSVPPAAIFSEYDYFSSYSDSWVAHAKVFADQMIERFNLNAGSKVVEIASNDGYLLQHFKASGIDVLGIEPAMNVADVAKARGIPTETAFFGRAKAEELRANGIAADLMVANNVLAHVPDINDFVAGFAAMLKPQGVVSFEFPHILRLLEQLQFDTIYHEHFSYLSAFTVDHVFQKNGLRVFDIEQIPTHGGSIRVFACRPDADYEIKESVSMVLRQEMTMQLDKLEGYKGFASKVENIRKDFLDFIAKAKKADMKIAAYGAAAKGNTFLNFCGVTTQDIIEVYDRNISKQGKLLPGTHIPIVDTEAIKTTKPDYLLVLPWNLIDEIRTNMSCISDWGGRFVTAIPRIKVF